MFVCFFQECNPESPASQCLLMQGSLGGPEEQQRELEGQDLQSMLEEMRDEREGDQANKRFQSIYLYIYF